MKSPGLDNHLPLRQGERSFLVRNLGPVVVLVLMLAVNSFAAPAVVQSSALPEPGLLFLLGGGLVGLATLIRTHVRK